MIKKTPASKTKSTKTKSAPKPASKVKPIVLDIKKRA